MGVVLEVIMCSADVCVAVLLAALLVLAGANQVLSVLASAFRFMQTAIISANLLHVFAASLLLDPNLSSAPLIASSSFGSNGATDNLGQDLAYLFLLIHKYGYLLALSKYKAMSSKGLWIFRPNATPPY
jgi:hypothetical protein